MDLSTFELSQGVIINADDPTGQGMIQCGSLNDFNTLSSAKELLPWIKPFATSGYQRYSQMQPKQKVWILKDTNNVDCYWYIPAPDLTNDAKEIVANGKDDDVEITHLRQTTGGKMMQTVDNKNGYITETQTSKIKVGTAGDVMISTPNSKIDMTENNIELRAGDEDTQYMLKGDKVKELFSHISTKLQQIATVCSTNFALMDLQLPILELAQMIDSECEEIQSTTIKNS